MPWRTVGGQKLALASIPELQVLIEGVFEKRRFLNLLRHFVVFEDAGGGTLAKKMAGYHQFHAVNVAVEETLRASRQAATSRGAGEDEGEGRYDAGGRPGGEPGDRRIGVVWHTQGAGKSLTMAFYAGRLVLHPEMKNPTIVVLTDRNDLDDQLFGTFSRCHEVLRQPPVQAESREDLRKKLSVDSGGVVFTTIQKFFPEERGDAHPVLSSRRNIVVIADEAHRSQYYFVDGFARHMRDALPHASFVGFTGTPIELNDKNTRAVFGDYISVYDIQRAVQDGATVPIYYESRLAKLELKASERPKIDPEFEEVTEGEEVERKEKLKSRWAQLTGFDAPSLHTMYVDKPVRDHGLMQAIARVNRVFRDKPGGLVVDYLGLAEHLREALVNYTQSGGTGETAVSQEEAVSLMREKYEVSRPLTYSRHRCSPLGRENGRAGRPGFRAQR
jgi:type I restriction enzyme R subunit